MQQLKKPDGDRLVCGFLLLWFIFNCIQAASTGLLHDETYYWMYSNNLDWGYFDHPPAIAVMIKIGYFIFHNAFGVRFFTIVFNGITIWCIWRLCAAYKIDAALFILIILSLVFVHAGGFIAAPDVPLMLFTALFYLIYKKYITRYDIKTAVLLSIIIAAALYSKYHILVVLFFTLLSNLKLLTKRSFWLIIFLTGLIYLPHILWQIHHDFPSIKFHISERFGAPYHLSQSTDYLFTQLLLTGGLSGLILFYAALKNKNNSNFEHSLKINLAGMFLLFLLATLKGRSEANWTVAGIIPLIILSYRFLSEKTQLRKWFIITGLPVVLFIFIIRIAILFHWSNSKISLTTQMNDWDVWAEQIKKSAEGMPVVFMNSYQKASKYTWYTGDQSYTFNNVIYRRSQYQLWKMDSVFQGEKIFYVVNYALEGSEKLNTVKGDENYLILPDFYSYEKINIRPALKNYYASSGDTIETLITIYNNGDDANFEANPKQLIQLNLVLQKEGKIYYNNTIGDIDQPILKKGENHTQKIQLPIAVEPGFYEMLISLKSGNLPAGLQGEYVLIHVK